MNQKENTYKYPTRYELNLTLSELTTRAFAERLAKSKGIFFPKGLQSEIADSLSSLFWGHSDLEKIRNAAYNSKVKKTLAGFIVRTEDTEFDLPRFLDTLRRNNTLGKDYELGPLRKMSIQDSKENMLKDTARTTYKSSLNYIKRKPGRIEFLSEEIRQFDFTIEERNDSEWKILVECQKSTDANEIKKIIETQAPKNSINIDQLEYDLLSPKETIEFFDKLADVGMSKDWRIEDIKYLIFRRGEDEEEEEATEEQLSGIRQAKLDGTNLRQNPFVKQSEKSGYSFTAMTYRYEHKTKGIVIQISAEFKMRPKVFEISITNYWTRVGIGSDSNMIKEKPPIRKELEIKSHFWNRARQLFNEITETKKETKALLKI